MIYSEAITINQASKIEVFAKWLSIFILKGKLTYLFPLSVTDYI